ncbi:MAG TPA: putative Ig domain-containing protein, partial [Actinomycetota bacterium]
MPVVHSESSGATAQFTAYLDQQYPDTWRPFSGKAGSTQYFPQKAPAVAQNGSDGVMNFVTRANGAIAYDEYSYALGQNYPVAKLENSAGFFTLPTQYNVAIALTKAVINQDPASPDYLLADLSHVYTNDDPRAYPLSSYAYGIIPTAPDDARMNTAKRQTLADYLSYSLCRGQYETGPIGYSPLPYNLVQGAFQQIDRLKQADPNVDLTGDGITTCDNPTFVPGDPSSNRLLQTAPQPAPCDQAGQGPCGFLEVDTTPLPSGRVGTPYSARLLAHGGTAPYSWQVLGPPLPPGLILDPATGTISGTPSASTTNVFTVQVTDSTSPAANRASALVTLVVNSSAPVAIVTASLPTATVGSPYTATLTATGGSGPYTWSVKPGSLPAGLALAAIGVISGTPTTAGTVTFTAAVFDSATPQPGVALGLLSITIDPAPLPSPPLRIRKPHLDAGTVGSEYAETLQASGGTKPYTWSVAAGSLPPG